MATHESKFILGASLILVAAVIFAATVVWHDMRSAPSSAPGAGGPANTKPVVANLPHQQGVAAGINGSVINNDGSKIVVASRGSQTSATTTFTVLINSQTEIYKPGAQKSDAEYQQDMQNFLKTIQSSTADVSYIAPDRFVHVPLALSDLKAGANVFIMPVAQPQNNTVTALTVELLP